MNCSPEQERSHIRISITKMQEWCTFNSSRCSFLSSSNRLPNSSLPLAIPCNASSYNSWPWIINQLTSIHWAFGKNNSWINLSWFEWKVILCSPTLLHNIFVATSIIELHHASASLINQLIGPLLVQALQMVYATLFIGL